MTTEYSTLDLFSGCGGLSLGFQQAGFALCGHIENEESALNTLLANLHNGNLDNLAIAHDITKVRRAKNFLSKAGIDHVDCIIGGPPCQAYSLIGRAKLNSIAGHSSGYLEDERGSLFQDYIRFVRQLSPTMIVMENVPQSLNYGGRNIPEETSTILNKLGYYSRYTILNAASYGVPQYRERMFLIAIKKKLKIIPTFPAPTHELGQFAKDYKHAQSLEHLAGTEGFEHAVYVSPNLPDLPPAITAEEAISDLPFISYYPERINICTKNNDLLPYRSVPLNDYQRLMRKHNGNYVMNNHIRYTIRDFPIFALMKEGDSFPDAIRIANRLKSKYIEENEIEVTPEIDKKLNKKFIPPYPVDSFESKWKVISRNKPCHTILAHLSIDTYSHIHYSSEQARGISVREAARFQSFPDWFEFPHTNMGAAYKQIGNAVPPLLAKKIAMHLKSLVESQQS